MKKSRIIILTFLVVITLAGCTNNQDSQLQQENDLLNQQNALLQQQVNPQDTNTNTPGYVIDNTNTSDNDNNIIDNTKTIPFDAVDPANKSNENMGFYY